MKYLTLLFACLNVALGQSWVYKISTNGTVLGDALTSNPLNTDIIYAAPGGRQLYVSRNRGYTWRTYGSLVTHDSIQNVIKSISVNPLDTLQLLVGVESNNSAPDRIMKSTDGGLTWTKTWGGSFAYYGKPVEFKPIHPDTVYTMGNDTLWRSTDFGSTWDSVRRTTGLFTAWCDAEIRPDSSNIIYLGDFSTGIWKTTNYGISWREVYPTSGEVPCIAIDPFNPRVAYATKFAGGGGVIKSTDGGETWHSITTPIGGGPGWWITCSTTAPGYVYFGTYGAIPGGIYVSADAGTSWRNFNAGLTSNALINYGLLALDTLTVIASQFNGVWRLQYPTTIQIVDPNGGEFLRGGFSHTISWTQSNLYSVKLAFTTNNGSSWNPIAESVAATPSSYDWSAPMISSALCRIRISDARFTATADTSDSVFTIYTEPLAILSPAGGATWDVGSTHSIVWRSYNTDMIKLDYSEDSGATWHYITKLSAHLGAYAWTVPNTPSAICKVRLASLDDSTIFKESDSVFTISLVSQFSATVRLRDGDMNRDSLKFGTAAGATDGIDSALGEYALPPKPGQGTFDVRWKLPDSEETKIDIRDTLSSDRQRNIFEAELQPGGGGYPFVLSWEPESLRAGTLLLRDRLTHGALFGADMRKDSVATIDDSTVSAVEVVQCKSVMCTYQGEGGWLLMSLPVEVADRRKSVLFPYSLSNAFAYNSGYVKVDRLDPGVGYWLKSEQTTVIGCPRLVDTVDVSAGWNIIGSISFPVAVSSIVAIPDTIVASNYFEYENSYMIADSITPGKGYWIKIRANGKLIISSTTQQAPAGTHVAAIGQEFNSLTVSDGDNHRQTLYFGVRGEASRADFYQMPPSPPSGVFDARFGSQRLLEVHEKIVGNPVEFPIILATNSSNFFFSWRVDNDKNFNYILIEKIGATALQEMRLAGSGSKEFQHLDQATFKLAVRQSHGSAEIPVTYSLGQMYPNPFNPTTHFTFAVPSDSYVRIKVFTVLGSEVATLVDGVRSSGDYHVDWAGTSDNGTTVSSGIYFIKMTASSFGAARKSSSSEFSAVRKIVFMK